ncbi:tRNA pseudouridine(38-40) synthase TruA [Luoshenia tenuis]|jgi:tRNA pseudouridine38-40 synthase|uniref:tRNA pseudouridine(38-40) synthase TruA n=1 Tax=Luoshenia tenuis TaxID=2763654 RepID=UPI003D8A0FFD
MRVKLIVEYDGTRYAGWQRQKNAVAVQQRLEEAIWAVTGEHQAVTGASRTDAGVHALGQCVHFDTQCGIPAEKFSFALNTRLPEDIRVVASERAADDFHARFMACGKRYRYLYCNRPHQSALARNFSWHVFWPLDVDKMRAAGQLLLGYRDFAAFMAAGSPVKDTRRTLTYLDVQRERDFVTLTVEGDGFLYNMVRIIAGNLNYVGQGKMPPEMLLELLNGAPRRLGGPTAPPQGLRLERVFYPGDEANWHPPQGQTAREM